MTGNSLVGRDRLHSLSAVIEDEGLTEFSLAALVDTVGECWRTLVGVAGDPAPLDGADDLGAVVVLARADSTAIAALCRDARLDKAGWWHDLARLLSRPIGNEIAIACLDIGREIAIVSKDAAGLGRLGALWHLWLLSSSQSSIGSQYWVGRRRDVQEALSRAWAEDGSGLQPGLSSVSDLGAFVNSLADADEWATAGEVLLAMLRGGAIAPSTPVFLHLAEGAKKLSDVVSAESYYSLADVFNGDDAGDLTPYRDNQIKAGLDAMSEIRSRGLGSEPSLAVVSSLVRWGVAYKRPTVAAQILTDDRIRLDMSPSVARRNMRHLAWAWKWPVATREHVEPVSSDDPVPVVLAPPPPPRDSTQINRQVRRPSNRRSAPPWVELVPPSPSPGRALEREGLPIDLTSNDPRVGDPISLRAAAPTLIVAPGLHWAIADEAVDQLLQQGIAVLHLRAGSRRRAVPASTEAGEWVRVAANGRDSRPLVSQWLKSALKTPGIARVLLRSIVSGSGVAEGVVPIERFEVIVRELLDSGPRAPWLLRPPSHLARDCFSAAVGELDLNARGVPAVEALVRDQLAAVNFLLKVMQCHIDPVDSLPLAPRLGVVEVGAAPDVARVFAGIVVGALVTRTRPPRLRLRRSVPEPVVADATRSSLARLFDDQSEERLDGRTAVVIDDGLDDSMADIVSWLSAGGPGAHLFTLICSDQLAAHRCSRVTLDRFGTIVLPRELYAARPVRIALGRPVSVKAGPEPYVELRRSGRAAEQRGRHIWLAKRQFDEVEHGAKGVDGR